MRMTLGSYTFARNPNRMSDLMTPVLHSATVQTYTSVAFFDWGLSLVGKVIRLDWDLCQIAQYDYMEAIFKNNVDISFFPNDGNGKTYTVHVTAFDGQLFMYLNGTGRWRQKVYMDLLILSEGA